MLVRTSQVKTAHVETRNRLLTKLITATQTLCNINFRRLATLSHSVGPGLGGPWLTEEGKLGSDHEIDGHLTEMTFRAVSAVPQERAHWAQGAATDRNHYEYFVVSLLH